MGCPVLGHRGNGLCWGCVVLVEAACRRWERMYASCRDDHCVGRKRNKDEGGSTYLDSECSASANVWYCSVCLEVAVVI